MRRPFVQCLLLLQIGILALTWGANIASAQEPASSPILRIETGTHTAQIPSVASNATGRFLVTGSDDKTARVWNAADGRLETTLRPPLGPGDTGKVYAVALAPDGKTVACGGFTNAPGQGICLYLFDRATGRMQSRITGLPNVILSLAYSADGRFLAAGLGRHGISIFRTADGSSVAQDTQYADNCCSVDFNSGGRLVTASLDGSIRLYDRAFKLLARKPAPGGRFPWSAVFSPDGSRVAVGCYDSPKVSVLDAKDLSLVTTPETGDLSGGNLKETAWSADGRFLYAAGSCQHRGAFFIRRWADAGRGAVTDLLPGARDTIASLKSLPGGALAWSGVDPVWGILAGETPRLTHPSPVSDFRSQRNDFRLSPDGGRVQFRDGIRSTDRLQFSLSGRTMGAPDSSEMTPAVTEAPGLTLTDWQNSPRPKLNGKELTLTGHESAQAVALAPDGSRFLLGTSENVRCFDRTGHELWHDPSPEVTLAINVAPGGKVGAAAFGDGTIHWYRMTDGQELLALFPASDHARWIAWTPSGLYDCSPGGEDLLGWQIGRGGTQAEDFFSAGRFRAEFYRPAVVAAALPGVIASIPVVTQPPAPKPVSQILPPVLTIVSPENGAALTSDQVTLRYTVRTPSGEPASSVRVLVDGRPVTEQRDLHLVSRTTAADAPQEITVSVPQRDCEVSLIARNRFASSEPALVRLKWQKSAVPSDTFIVKPKLYVLAIGISHYLDPSLRLEYGASDAQDFAKILLSQKGRLYRDVQEKVLTDTAATKDDILDGLQWIREQVTSKDVAMIFLAGHGANDPDTGNYLFIPQNFDRTKTLRTGLPYTDIKSTVQAIAGKALFFIDTCHAGNVMGSVRSRDVVDVTSVINELSSAENGVVVFSASTGNQVSFEDAAWSHGAFTKALVEGLTGGADYQHTGRITINMLDLYLSERVKELTHGHQTPTTTKPQTVPDFPVVLAHE